MAQLSKQALIVENNTSFPNNNTNYITPAILRSFNVDMIDSLVDENTYNVDSASWNAQIAALDPSGSLNQLQSLNAFTGSQNTKNLAVAASTASLNAFSASQQTKDSTLGGITGSFLTTASVNLNTITFTKQDTSTFAITVNTGSTTATDISSLNAYTASQDNKNTAVGASTSSLNAFTASQVTKNSTLGTYTASVDTKFTSVGASTSSLNTFTSSQANINIAIGASTSSLNAFTASQSTKNSTLATYTASVDASSSMVNTKFTTLGTYTASVDTKFTSVGASTSSLNTATASLFTSASLSLTTASFTGNTLTFRKGDGTTFGVVIPDVSGSGTPSGTISGSAQITALGFVSSSVTASSLVTASAFTNTITFTKGDGTTFPVTVTTGSLNYVTGSFGAFHDTTTQSGSANIVYIMKLNNTDISDGVIISGSGGIKVLAAGTYDLQFSAQVLADTGADTVWIWLKKNGTNVSDTSTKLVLANNEANVAAWNFVVSANANDVFELAWQSSGGHTKLFSEAAAGNYPAIPSVIATMNRVDVGGGTNLVSTGSFNSFTSSINAFTASQETKDATLGALTGSFATTGSNVFTGIQTFQDAALNATSLVSTSGSLMLVAKSYTSASAHISASSNALVNLIFKSNSNTADTIISGSNNIFVNAQAPTAGFKRYLGPGNIALNPFNVPQITGSMGFSPTLSTNYFGGNATTLTMRGPVSSSAWTISGNSVLGTISVGSSDALHARGIQSGLTLTGNNIAGTLTIIANNQNLSSSLSITNTVLNGTATINANSSSVLMANNNINDAGFVLTNNFFSSSAGLGSVAANRNNIGGQAQTILVQGTLPAGTTTAHSISDNTMLGGNNTIFVDPTNSRVSGSNAYFNALRNIIGGNQLIVTGSSLLADGSSFGSAYFGRYNADDAIRNKTSDIVFAVGTGNTAARKTGFLIDSGSNSFFEGTLNVSGSTTMTGSLILSSSNAVELFVIGNSEFTGSVAGNLISASITSNTASIDFNLGNYFELTSSVTPLHLNITNIKPGTTSTLILSASASSSILFSPNVAQPSGSAYSGSLGSIDILSLVAFSTSKVNLVATKALV